MGLKIYLTSCQGVEVLPSKGRISGFSSFLGFLTFLALRPLSFFSLDSSQRC
jgi:hypothetical protein